MIKLLYPEGATPLEPEELLDLIPGHIKTQEELNLWEQHNILLATHWLSKKKKIQFNPEFLQDIHVHMFNKTWRWAGQYRRTGKNIGIDWPLIPTELKILCDDVKFQVENKTYDMDEIAIRFHHRLVWIHAFANGNGRHARLVADFFALQHKRPAFSWGLKMGENLYKDTEIRRLYIQALRAADQYNYEPLLIFARS